jgi:hypothetical protein
VEDPLTTSTGRPRSGTARCSYRPPFGPWAEPAAYDGERFVNVGSGRKRRIAPDDVLAPNRDILKDGREAHDYGIRPDGSR